MMKKMMKLMMATALATVAILGAFMEVAQAQVSNRRYGTQSNTAKILTFELNPKKPGTLENISLINGELPDPGQGMPGDKFIEDDEATISVYSVLKGNFYFRSDFFESDSFSEIIIYDVDNLSGGELTLYLLVPTGAEEKYSYSRTDILGLLDFPLSEPLALNAIFSLSPSAPDVFELTADEVEKTGISSLLKRFKNLEIEPAGPQFNDFRLTVEQVEKIPEPSVTGSMLVLGAFGLAIFRKRSMP